MSSVTPRNLTQVPAADVVDVLKQRFFQDDIFTELGPLIVALHPHKYVDALFNEKIQKKYFKNYKDIEAKVEPHVYAIATNAYLHLRRLKQDQSIILSGDSGAGQSLHLNAVLRQICAISGNSKKDQKTHNRVMAAISVLEAFGNAKTEDDVDSSRYGLFSEVQFNERGKMIGMKVLDYLLDKDRLVTFGPSERNFHAFYYLLNGADSEIREKCHLLAPDHFPILAQGQITIPKWNDEVRFEDLQASMKSIGMGKKTQMKIWQLLASILHLSRIEFEDSKDHADQQCRVKNTDVLDIVADLLEITSQDLLEGLTTSSALSGRDVYTKFLNAEDAKIQLKSLSKTLYGLLFTWIVEAINHRLCKTEFTNIIAILNFSGHKEKKLSKFYDFCVNSTNENIVHFVWKTLMERYERLKQDGFPIDIKNLTSNNQLVLSLLNNEENGILHLVNQETRRNHPNKTVHDLIDLIHKNHTKTTGYITTQTANTFGVDHYCGSVVYEANEFVQKNLETISADFISLFKNNPSSFVSDLFQDKLVSVKFHPRNEKTVVGGFGGSKPVRTPSVRRKRAPSVKKAADPTVLSELLGSLEDVIETLETTSPWYIFCIAPSDEPKAEFFEDRRVLNQVKSFKIADLIQQEQVARAPFTVQISIDDFANKYSEFVMPQGSARESIQNYINGFDWLQTQIFIGHEFVHCTEAGWRYFEDQIRSQETSKRRSTSSSRGGEDERSELSFDAHRSFVEVEEEESIDDRGSTMALTDQFQDLGGDQGADDMKGLEVHNHINQTGQYDVKEEKMTSTRRKWLCCVYCLTWMIPSFCICIDSKRKDIKLAWREKVALCILIFWMSAVSLFFIVGLAPLICPEQKMFSMEELQFKTDDSYPLVAVYGAIFNLQYFKSVRPDLHQFTALVDQFAGKDVTEGFRRSPGGFCKFANYDFDLVRINDPLGSTIRIKHKAIYNNADKNGIGDGEANLETYMQDPYGIVAHLGFSRNQVRDLSVADTDSRHMVILGDRIYDFTVYFQSATTKDGSKNFLQDFEGMINRNKGSDFANDPEFMDQWSVNEDLRDCFNNLFIAGKLDERQSDKCVFTSALLLAASALIVLTIAVKFAAALPLRSAGDPEDYDKFVILQVPCYTEGEESLKRTIDSLAELKYDDKRKLLFIVCDGMIIGSGNDRPTPRIVLDILGVDPNLDPEPLSFQSVGEGSKQHNMAKVFSGLYEHSGHLVPYLVIVKVGKPNEKIKPGNRGKRDSQMVLMRFLNRVFFDNPMSPLELEMYHQMKNVIGVDPSFYEFLFYVDADTVVNAFSLNRLIATMANDKAVVGTCGETRLANEEASWATMIQPYEYFISHHLSKAFEGMFGTVTCLPGCFCMYRLRSPIKNQPLLIHDSIVDAYSDINLDTLHKKNLLALGEDRYLTTLMLKNFPKMKTTFTPDAVCETHVPESWSVLLSQRRRWINSTIHNLFELLTLNNMCGFCIFSMRFFVFLDLFGTIIQPATVLYLVYLIGKVIYGLVSSTATIQQFPIISLIMLSAIYGLQVIIFIVRRQWQHIMWMFVYLLALPLFGFFIPIYSFWHFDDFSWGNTRIVIGEGSKQQIHTKDDELFDISHIPHKKFSDYEKDLWEDEEGKTQISHHTGMEQQAINRNSGFSISQSDYRSSAYEIPPMDYMSQPMPSGIPMNYSDSMLGSQYQEMPMQPVQFPDGSVISSRQHQEMMAQSMYGSQVDMGYHESFSPQQMGDEVPNHQELIQEVHRILSTSDLMQVSKKDIRTELSRLFQTNLDSRKKEINEIIDSLIQK
eukprot:NODE_23_length_42016_cov_0.755803.p1 type:complete len:1789 gc:universal NODE_23_length_42016_cov_0.755803:16324-10958(-)